MQNIYYLILNYTILFVFSFLIFFFMLDIKNKKRHYNSKIFFAVCFVCFCLLTFFSIEEKYNLFFYIVPFVVFCIVYLFSFIKKIFFYTFIIIGSIYSFIYSKFIFPKIDKRCSGLDFFCGTDWTFLYFIVLIFLVFFVLLITQLIQNIIKKKEAKKLENTINTEPLVK